MTEKQEISAVDAYKKLAESVQKSLESPAFRIDPTRLRLIVGDEKLNLGWQIKEDAHTNMVRNQVMEIAEQYECDMKALGVESSHRQRDRLQQETNGKILTLALEDFDWDAAANDPRIGPVLLNHISMEVYVFLVEHGGATGYQYLQTLRNLELLNRYNSSQNSAKSSGSSTDTSTDSAV